MLFYLFRIENLAAGSISIEDVISRLHLDELDGRVRQTLQGQEGVEEEREEQEEAAEELVASHLVSCSDGR